MLQNNFHDPTFDVKKIKPVIQKIIINTPFDDDLMMTIITFLKAKKHIQSLLMRGILDIIMIDDGKVDSQFFELFKSCINKYETSTQLKLLKLLIEETKPTTEKENIDAILGFTKQKST